MGSQSEYSKEPSICYKLNRYSHARRASSWRAQLIQRLLEDWICYSRMKDGNRVASKTNLKPEWKETPQWIIACFFSFGDKSFRWGMYSEPAGPGRFIVVYQSVKVKLGAVESTLTITKIMIGTKQPESGLAASVCNRYTLCHLLDGGMIHPSMKCVWSMKSWLKYGQSWLSVKSWLNSLPGNWFCSFDNVLQGGLKNSS